MNTARNPTTDDDKIADLLANLWRKNLPKLKERLDTLDRAAAAAKTGKLDAAAQAEALSIAHKLSGSLGMFGYPEGTAIAREMETALKLPLQAGLPAFSLLAEQLRKSVARGL